MNKQSISVEPEKPGCSRKSTQGFDVPDKIKNTLYYQSGNGGVFNLTMHINSFRIFFVLNQGF